MIKHLFILIIIFFSCLTTKAQQYGNEWINYTQKYYKLPIAQTGLYRINYNALANSGFPVNSVNPKNIQLFIRGEEQNILINGENDGVFNNTDYIEFYAEKNDGRADSLAYDNISRLPNPHVALFNDTAYAFVTWNSSNNNKRVTIENDLNFSGYTAENYIYTEKIFAGNNTYSYGQVPFSGIYDPRYLSGEGYGYGLDNNQSFQLPFNTTQLFQSSSLPVNISIGYSGNSTHFIGGYDHHAVTSYLDNNGNYITLNDTSFYYTSQIQFNRTLFSNQLQNSSHIKIQTVSIPNLPASGNKINIHYIKIKYPQIPDLNSGSEFTFYINDNNTQSKTFIDLQNVQINGNSVILYDLTNHKYISVQNGTNNVKALIPNSLNQKKCFLTNSGNIKTVSKILPVNQNGYFINHKTNNTDSAFVIVSNKALQYAVTEYYTYRQSPAGGNNNVIIGFVDELYDQFAYGNNKNPIAIKNFCKFLSDSLPVPPKYLLLLGKSIKNEETRANGFYWNANLVPTMGKPASDNLFTTSIKGLNSTTPFIPTGRISASNNNEAIYYLNKVKAHESSLIGINSPNLQDWRKHVLHFAGGTNSSEQTMFKSFLNNYENIINDTLFGGKTYTFYKTTTSPYQITISDSVKQLMDYGASIVTFFGHGSVTGFDQAIDDPNVYNNINKYPLFIANSCYSGDIHRIESISASEKFVLANEKGSIGFIASSSTGVVSSLNNFSTALYQSMAYETYFKGVGDALKNSCSKNSTFPDQLTEISCLEMTLEGDPSIKLNAYKKPDYEIKNTSVYFNTTTFVDSIGINIVTKNLGKAINDTFMVRVERYFPSGDSITFLKKIKAPYNIDTLSFFILKDYVNGVGLNHFKVHIDNFNEIDEMSENNNSTNGFIDLFIPGGDIVPVYPYKYAIIPNTPQVTLKASTADPFALNTTYKIQLDTNDVFNSPVLTSTVISSSGGVINWTVNLPFGDSTVYFWRVTKDSLTTTDKLNWRESSFQVIGTKTGWAQAHFHQFKNDSYQFVKYQKPARKFEFANDIKSLECNNRIINAATFDQMNYKVNGSLEDYYSCAPGGWAFAVFDSISVKAWENNTPSSVGIGPFGNCKCVNYTLKSFAFGLNTLGGCGTIPTWQTDMQNFINNIPANSKILAWSTQNHQTPTYPNSLYNAFESFGAANIRSIQDNVPYIIFGTKGKPIGSAHEVLGTDPSSIIQLIDTLKTRWNSGYIASEIIGPSVNWRSLHWKQASLETPTTDSIVLKLVGIRNNGIRDTLGTFSKYELDVLNLSSYIDASSYPYLQLVARMWDNNNVTPPQLKKWQVIYDEVPECAINPKKGFAINQNALQEGDKLIVKFPIENIGELTFNDSLLVTYWISDKANITHTLPQKLKRKLFAPTEIIIDTINFDTKNFPGLNYLWIDVNPPANNKYQLEQYHFNNVARIGFNVNVDNINPLLDVTFDGSHILNGDIVSSKTNVLITLKDENNFLALNDTANFAIFVKYPNQATEKRLYFANTLFFTPAQLPNNSCKIEWKPNGLEDGKYKLIVQATDRSRNVSGAVDYNIQFEVINKQTVTEVLNYPNPFSTSTKFVFTLTGSEIPDVFTIQIMTITGKVVREITKNELGNLHVGRNITQYAWDGRDEYGDKLANGVYLYRVITRHNGKAIEKTETDADSFFKKGIGKLVIMR